MSGAALFDFIISLVVLGGIVAMFFITIDKTSPDATFRQLARIAIGVVAFVVFLGACKAVFFGGGGGLHTGAPQLIEFAIGLIILLVLWYAACIFIRWLNIFPNEAMYVLGAVVLVVLLFLAERALYGGGFGLINGGQTLLR